MRRDSTTNPDDRAGANRTTEQPWHTLSVSEVADTLRTDPSRGLTNAEAAGRREQYGPNTLTEAKGRSALAIVAAQFKSLIVALLVTATVLAFVLGDNIEAVAIAFKGFEVAFKGFEVGFRAVG